MIFPAYLLWLFTASFGLVHALSNCSYQAVQEYLGLDKDNIKMTSLRPVLHWRTPTLVLADIYVSSITEMNEKAQTFSPLVYLEMGWVNEFTKWNPADFCGIDHISVPKEMLWIPDITITENIRAEFSTKEPPFLKIKSEGIVAVVEAYTMTSACKMDLHLFPFDIQSCTLTLQSFLHNIDEIKIDAYSNASILTISSKQFFQTQGEWDLVSINMSKAHIQASGRVWDQLTYTITIKRRPLLYVVIFLLPILYFLVLDLACFFIADDGGEKLSFKVTLLLAISVLLLILHDMLPSTSDDLPLIGVYCSGIFTFTAVSLLETILVTFLKTQDVQAIAKLYGKTATASALLDTREGASQRTPDSERSGELCSNTVLQRILTELQNMHQHLLTKETQKQKMTLRWTKVAKAIDKTFTVIYVSSVTWFLQHIWQAWSP
ncbi:5-hydroxytryptamine receptor 3A-like [Salminus brasiliensis]|uniref:5-hydroxytryptamine receptor 3A-like n=1 Tax=Salminus brasiliensis TaxID=930266 RepID=UPI003B8327D0